MSQVLNHPAFDRLHRNLMLVIPQMRDASALRARREGMATPSEGITLSPHELPHSTSTGRSSAGTSSSLAASLREGEKEEAAEEEDREAEGMDPGSGMSMPSPLATAESVAVVVGFVHYVYEWISGWLSPGEKEEAGAAGDASPDPAGFGHYVLPLSSVGTCL